MLVSSQHIDVGAHQKSNKCFLNGIVGAGALVSKDLKPNGVYVGVSAKRICSFDDYVNRHCEKNEYGGGDLHPYVRYNQNISEDEVSRAWVMFETGRSVDKA